MKGDSFFYLLRDAFFGSAVRRIERAVVAKRTSAGANRSVTVRTCEAGIDAYFLRPSAEDKLEIVAITVKTAHLYY